MIGKRKSWRTNTSTITTNDYAYMQASLIKNTEIHTVFCILSTKK